MLRIFYRMDIAIVQISKIVQSAQPVLLMALLNRIQGKRHL